MSDLRDQAFRFKAKWEGAEAELTRLRAELEADRKMFEDQVKVREELMAENQKLRGALAEISRHQADSELDGRLVSIAKQALEGKGEE